MCVAECLTASPDSVHPKQPSEGIEVRFRLPPYLFVSMMRKGVWRRYNPERRMGGYDEYLCCLRLSDFTKCFRLECTTRAFKDVNGPYNMTIVVERDNPARVVYSYDKCTMLLGYAVSRVECGPLWMPQLERPVRAPKLYFLEQKEAVEDPEEPEHKRLRVCPDKYLCGYHPGH